MVMAVPRNWQKCFEMNNQLHNITKTTEMIQQRNKPHLTLSVTVVTVLDNHPKFHLKKGSSKTFPMSIAPISR